MPGSLTWAGGSRDGCAAGDGRVLEDMGPGPHHLRIRAGFFLRLIVLAYPRSDPRRAELIAELYAVPRAQRPLWVAEQLEISLSEGLWHRMSAALRQLSHRLSRRNRTPVQPEDETARQRMLLAHSAAIMFSTGVATQWPVPSQIEMTEVTQLEAVIRAMRALDISSVTGRAVRRWSPSCPGRNA